MRSEGSRMLGAVEMTRRDLARKIGVGPATITRWVSGETVPAREHRRVMARYLGIPEHAWPDEWARVRDTIVELLSERAPHLLVELERRLVALEE